jgi:hypothetical protein
MKNKSTMILVGVGIAYLLYRLYAKKLTAPVNTTASVVPTILKADTEQIIANGVPRQYLVDKTRDESINYDTPNTYQTFYGRSILAGTISKVPSTC